VTFLCQDIGDSWWTAGSISVDDATSALALSAR
jgi:hypothetical protein